VLQVIAITGMGDHHRLDQPIAITGIRTLPKADIFTRHGQASIGRRPAVLRIVPYYAAALALLYV